MVWLKYVVIWISSHAKIMPNILPPSNIRVRALVELFSPKFVYWILRHILKKKNQIWSKNSPKIEDIIVKIRKFWTTKKL